MTNFRLIETMRVSSAGTVDLIDRHLERLRHSAAFFSFPCDLEQIRKAVSSVAGPARLRLTLAADGIVAVETGALPEGYVERLKLSAVRADSSDVFLRHKTTNRRVYEEARAACDRSTDVILVNERGEITETPIMNISVWHEGQWRTPPVSCGLLPGVMRDELLSRGEIVEGVIHAGDLQPGELIRCFNAVRGIFEIPLLLL